MKKSLVVSAFCLALSLAALAQDTTKDASKDAANTPTVLAAIASPNTVSGTVKSEGDKLTFVSDNDQKSWDVQNPEALKGFEGQHVQLQIHSYPDKSSINVIDVKQLKNKEAGKTDEVKK